MTVHLTSRAGFDLIVAGQALAVYQVAGVVSRPIWGWLADRCVPARVLLAVQGLIMCGAAILAGRFAPGWSQPLVLVVCAVAGATASGFTGIAYAEFARIGGARRTEATGLGAGIMFAGVMVMPSAFALVVVRERRIRGRVCRGRGPRRRVRPPAARRKGIAAPLGVSGIPILQRGRGDLICEETPGGRPA